MNVRDLLSMEIDIDVYDDVCEELAVAFCGSLELTEEGKRKFAEALDYDVTLNMHSYGDLPAAIIHVDDEDDDVWEARLAKAAELFEAAAGYCSIDDYKKWFKED